MPFKTEDIRKAITSLNTFRQYAVSPYHERVSFPFLCGTYFAYRKIDVLRIVSIAKAISSNPRYLDVGCGYGDFLEKIREYLPNAIGVEKEGNIFYAFRKTRPDYIHSTAIEWIKNQSYDVAFVGWMEPGVDFREHVARLANCIVTTFDEGGQCGVYGSCEYEEFGFKRVAWWRTPSWIDVNTELMNKYYSSTLQSDQKQYQLSKLRSAHNLWFIYARACVFSQVVAGLKSSVAIEKEASSRRRFDFESILDECGFHYMEDLPSLSNKVDRLWEVKFG